MFDRKKYQDKYNKKNARKFYLRDREKNIVKSTTRNKERRRKYKIRAIELKGGCCQKCGYNKCVAALEFHHIESEEKEINIGKFQVAWQKIVIELEKCILVCSNCHREIHWELNNAPVQ